MGNRPAATGARGQAAWTAKSPPGLACKALIIDAETGTQRFDMSGHLAYSVQKCY